MRTGALGPGEIAPYTAHGFAVEATLILLRHGLRDSFSPCRETFRRVRRGDWSTLAAIDDAAFPPYWHFDERSLRDAQAATPSSRTRVAGGRSPIGYAITGRTGSTGFVQRLAVHPSATGRGIGRALTLDGLHWLRRRGSKQAFVNTQDDNKRALALYLDLGFWPNRNPCSCWPGRPGAQGNDAAPIGGVAPHGRRRASTLSGFAGAASPAAGVSPPAHLVLIDQSPTVGPEGPFEIRLRLEGTAAPDLDYAIDVHPAVTDRVGLRAAARRYSAEDHAEPQPHRHADRGPASPDSAGEFTLTLKITEQRVPAGSDALRLTKVGVYPVTIVLRDGEGNPVDTVQTAMVRLAATPATRPFRVAFAIGLTGPQLFDADLRVHLDQATLDNVARTTAALVANPTMPVTVSPAPDLLDALAHAEDPQAKALLTDLDHALAGHQILANTYVPIDAPAFMRHNLAGELDTQLIAGENVLRDALPSTQPDRRTWLPSGPLDEPTLGRLQTLGSNQLVIAAGALEPAEGDAANAFRPVEVSTSGGAIPTAVVDADLQRALSLDLPATVAPIRLYLELAFVALQHPDIEEGAVIVPPDGVTLSAGFLTQFLGLVQRTSLIATVTVDDYFRLTRPAVDAEGEPVVRTLRSVSTDSLGVSYPSEVYLLRLDALSTAAMVPGQADMPPRIEKLVLLADRLGLSDTDRRPYLANAHAPLDAVKKLVAVGDQGTVTLTSGSDAIRTAS